MPKSFTVEAAVHMTVGNGYRVKVSVLGDVGLYINGMMVYPPNEDHPEWSVLTPARPAGRGRYVRIVEFNMKFPLWNEIYDECVNAVKLYRADAPDVVITDIPDGPITLDDIPINLDDIPF